MKPLEIEEYKRKWLMSKCYRVRIPSSKEETATDWCKTNINSWEWATSEQSKIREHTFFFEKKEHSEAFEKEFT
jgi:hypothetical protein